MTAVTDTLSGYSKEALRAMRDQAKAERKDDEAGRYDAELRRRLGGLCEIASSQKSVLDYVYGEIEDDGHSTSGTGTEATPRTGSPEGGVRVG